MQLPKETLLDMFWTMLLSRRTDERAWVLHRQGKIAFHISGIGQEAAQVGAAFAIKRGCDWVSPYYHLPSATFDHHILDGASADWFLAKVADSLQNWS